MEDKTLSYCCVCDKASTLNTAHIDNIHTPLCGFLSDIYCLFIEERNLSYCYNGFSLQSFFNLWCIKLALQTLTLQGFQGTLCKSILTGKNLFSLQGTLFSLQGSCFHYRDFPVNPGLQCTSNFL